MTVAQSTDTVRIRIVGSAIVTRNAGGDDEARETIQKVWLDHDVMRLSICRAWVTRTFNRLRRGLGPGDVLRVRYEGQMQQHPFSSYGGGLRGTTRILIGEGDME